MKLKGILIILVGLFSSHLQAQFTTLTSDEVQDVVETLGKAMLPSNVNGAATLGKIWGVDAGLILHGLEDDQLKQAVGGDAPSMVPSAALGATVTLPFGIGAEASLLPNLDLDKVELDHFMIGARWTVNKLWNFLPPLMNLNLNANLSNSSIFYEDSFSGLGKESVDVDYDNFQMGATVSVNVFLAEVYASATYFSMKSDYEFKSSLGPVSGPLTPGSSTNEGIRPTLGVILKIPMFRLSAEASSIEDDMRYSFKLSLKI